MDLRAVIEWLKNWWRVRTSYLNPASLEEVEIEISPDRCAHAAMRVANARLTQEHGLDIYAQILLECTECQEMWRLQHRFAEVAQITGGHERFLSPRELGLEVRAEGGELVKTDRTEETLRILRANHMAGRNGPYKPAKKAKKKGKR